MNFLYLGIFLIVLSPAHALFALRAFNHSDFFTNLAVRTIALAPAWFFVGVGMLIVYGTQWFDSHTISISVK